MKDEVRRKRLWRRKFAVAFRGIGLGFHGHFSFFVLFFFASMVLATATVLGCEAWQWCALLGCIGMVLTAELFNRALETLFQGLDEETRARAGGALVVANGAVLMASLSAAVIGSVVFLVRLLG